MKLRGRWRLALVLSLVCLVLGAATLAAGWMACDILGKTPAELIDYGKHRLHGHARAEMVTLPVLNALRRVLADEDETEALLPFAVPPLPPNPGTGAVSGPPDSARVIRVGPGRAISRIGVAAQVARDGDVIEIEPGDYVADVAKWEQAHITIRGLGNRVRLIAQGANMEGKGIWVFRSHHAVVENIQFVGARASDRNGAGIRLERGHLLVKGCSFLNSENGILTSSEPATSLEVEDSDFGYNGAGDGLSHGIYVGRIDSFRLTGSYLHHGNVGHLVKSRARTNRIEYNRISDESGGRSSYEIDLPNGGTAEVVGNIIQKGRGARNSALVSFGAEGYRWPSNELRMAHNTFVNDLRLGGSFLRVAPGASLVELRNNVFVGPGKIGGGAVLDAAGDRHLDWPDLVRPAREDYRLNERTRAELAAVPLAAEAAALVPRFEYQHPASVVPLRSPPSFPGALQSGAAPAL
jgi:hypothetical protein